MRTKQLVTGLKNTQKIRVICDGVGFNTTVTDAFGMTFQSQRYAVGVALESLGYSVAIAKSTGKDIPTGYGRTVCVYSGEGRKTHDVQVDLI